MSVEEDQVTRPPVDVRRAGSDDVEDLVLLWTQARAESSGASKAFTSTAPEHVRGRLRHAFGAPDVHVLVARWEGRPAGYAVLRVAPLMPIVDDPSMHVESMYVTPDLRRHGVAKGLLAAVASLADRSGAEQVVISAPPTSREAHRFLARLGFTPLAVRRIVSTGALRRRLSGETRRTGLEDLLSRRRSLRARADTAASDGSVIPGHEGAGREGTAARLRAQTVRARRIDLDAVGSQQVEEEERGAPSASAQVDARLPQDTLELPIVVSE